IPTVVPSSRPGPCRESTHGPGLRPMSTNPRGSAMTRTTRIPALPALAPLAGLAACRAGDAPARGGGAAATTTPGGGAADVPAPAPSAMTAEDPGTPAPEAKTGTIAVGGGTAEIAFKRFDAPAGFPLQFSTYVPEDMIVETTTAAGGRDAVR